MDVRFYLDPDTRQPHIYAHGVTEEEVLQVLSGPGEDLAAARGTRMKLGRSAAGRHLQVIYAPDEEPDGVFVITAYELRGKAKRHSDAANGGSHDERSEITAGMG